jgi:uncharacterized protein
MSVTLVYLHGFRSSPASAKARLFGAAVAALPAHDRPRLHVPELPHRPALAMTAIDALAANADRSRLAFVGSSLGGYYATVAAERYGARAVLINPAVRPDLDLRAHAGIQVNLYTGASFEVTPSHFDELRAMRVARISDPGRYFLLVQTGDEVLDYRRAVEFYAGGSQLVQGGGDHAFTDFHAQIPAILRFCGVSPSLLRCR